MTFEKAVPGNAENMVDIEARLLFEKDSDLHKVDVAHEWTKKHTQRDLKDVIDEEVRKLLRRIDTMTANKAYKKVGPQEQKVNLGESEAAYEMSIQDDTLSFAPKSMLERRNGERKRSVTKTPSVSPHKIQRLIASNDNPRTSITKDSGFPTSLATDQVREAHNNSLAFRSNMGNMPLPVVNLSFPSSQFLHFLSAALLMYAEAFIPKLSAS